MINKKFYQKINSKYISIVSFNSKLSFLRFNIFLKKIKILNFKIKVKPLKIKTRVFSILKSPHINKSAQEQFYKIKKSYIFEFESFSNYYIFCLLLKKLKHNSFSDVSIKSKIFYNSVSFLPTETLLFLNHKILKTNIYFFLLDSIGESFITKNNFCTFSSVG